MTPPRFRDRWRRRNWGGFARGLCWLGIALLAGCDAVSSPATGPLFGVPLEINGESVGTALIDTGGGYEIMLRDAGNLRIVDSSNVVVFAGLEPVELTEGFFYRAGGVSSFAKAAIVSGAICNCNGIGFEFFRKTGTVLALDFAISVATFVAVEPVEGIKLRFIPPPPQLPNFDSSFIEIRLPGTGVDGPVTALLDTGANTTVIRRGLLAPSLATITGQQRVTLSHAILGEIVVDASLFDNPGLPDVIIGTEAMTRWGNRWYFTFTPQGGIITVQRDTQVSSDLS